MNKRDFAAWCLALSDRRVAQVSELCWEAMVTFEDVNLDDLRDGIRRALEDCWLARLHDPLPESLELLKSEMSVLHSRIRTG